MAPDAGCSAARGEAGEDGGERWSRLREGWSRALADGVKCDGWGQVVEALESYEALVDDVVRAAPQLGLSSHNDALLHGVVCVVLARCAALGGAAPVPAMDASCEAHDGAGAQAEEPATSSSSLSRTSSVSSSCSCSRSSPGGECAGAVSLDDMKALARALDELLAGGDKGAAPRAPLSLHLSHLLASLTARRFWRAAAPALSGAPALCGPGSREGCGGTLAPRPRAKAGQRTLSIEIKAIGVKDAELLLCPCFRVSVLGRSGAPVERVQETPTAARQVSYRCDFAATVHIQSSLEELLSKDCAVFFELVHWKADKRKHSTKCWALLEPDEIEAAAACKLLELYKKPVSQTRKSFRLCSKKKLFLEINLLVSHSSLDQQ
jgi:hypothetical protein